MLLAGGRRTSLEHSNVDTLPSCAADRQSLRAFGLVTLGDGILLVKTTLVECLVCCGDGP